VEEVDVEKLKEMVHVKDGDGAAQAVVGHEGGGAVHTAERKGEIRP
jgi:hypothetical protein